MYVRPPKVHPHWGGGGGGAGAGPGFLKRGVRLRFTSKERGVQEGVQLWAQC